MIVRSGRRSWRGRFLACLGIAVVFGGCLRSTESTPSALQLSGDWSYEGVQTAPVREILTGQLRILGESGTSFQGTLSMVGVNEATGDSRVMTGTVSGSGDGGVIDFDANVETAARRHVGQLVGNIITGTWVGPPSGGGGAMSSGNFRAERVSQ
jgi:hypothetical protein